MLHFFRKHQKYFFLFTTIIIVTSFAFFGSYQAFSPSSFGPSESNEVLYHTLDGKPVRKAFHDHMARFLEREEWMQTTKIFEANYLNDGVISKDFLEGGLYTSLVAHYGENYREALAACLEREQNFKPYQHPALPAINATSIWALFAPEISEKLPAVQSSDDPVASFDDRVALFLAERSFPPAFLTQMLRYQESDSGKPVYDPRLQRDVISLFGYLNHTDWFGEPFVESVAELVIQTAAIARQKGYSVSHEEALTEMLYKSQKTYEAITANMDLPLENGEELFAAYLRYKGLDQATAVQIWEEIALFRRMMQEVGTAALVDALPLEQFYSFANENATIELVQMAPEYRFRTEEEKQLFAAYLEAVSPVGAAEIPLALAPIETIKARAPELVGKRYRIYVGAVDKESLQARVSVKETWDWEVANLSVLEQEFPELAGAEGTPFERLEQAHNRKKIDAFARAQVVSANPEWIDESVRQADMEEKHLFLSAQEPLPGISDLKAFGELLDTENEVVGYTQDGQHYYRIIVDERSETEEVLAFREAKEHLKPSDTNVASFVSYLEQYRDEQPESAPWAIEKKEVRITRAAPTFVTLDEALALEGESYSAVKEAEGEGAYCFKLNEVFVDTSVPMQKWLEAQEVLAKEMRARFFEDVVDQVCSKN